MPNKKQRRRGKKISRKIANLGAISQEVRELCPSCMAEITSADYEGGKCSQCQFKISVPESHIEWSLRMGVNP